MALTKRFRKIIWTYVFLAFEILLVVQLLSLTNQRTNWVLKKLQVNLNNVFGSYLMSLMTLNIFVLRRRR